MKTKVIIIFVLSFIYFHSLSANPIIGMLERIDRGASKKFSVELIKADYSEDFFELDYKGGKVVVKGNNYVSIATGINWYLKYSAGVHITWNNPQAKLPTKLPVVKKERFSTKAIQRFYFNYCTFSYSMAFWDWKRWEQEIDWMAMHGVNIPLALTGTEAVWYNLLTKLGYSHDEANDFIAGPGFLAWWHMNNLEGWGGPNSKEWYEQQVVLQKKIMARQREFGIEPCLPGYAGMVPNNAKMKLGLSIQDPGVWCGFRRPAFLQPSDSRFEEIADLYYKEMTELFGTTKYYGIDPFHEGGSTAGVNLQQAGQALMGAMKRCNPDAVWVVQAWQANPRMEMMRQFKNGDVLALDLFSEGRPQWGDPKSTWHRPKGYEHHDWIFCLLENFGGNIGLFGKMERMIDGYYLANELTVGKEHLRGVGATMEGIETNPVMYELLFELPWRKEKFSKEEWIKGYIKARYGRTSPELESAWITLMKTVYNPPYESTQEGCTESILCSRPAFEIKGASSWGTAKMFYKGEDLLPAAKELLKIAPKMKGNRNFEYDLVDVVRQTLSDKANRMHIEIVKSFKEKDKLKFEKLSKEFLQLILDQDYLLSSIPDFMVGTWIEQAKSIGQNSKDKEWIEWNARALITVWGNEYASNTGGLRDYSHREWNGILKDLYYPRWETYFAYLTNQLDGKEAKAPNYYLMEEAWTKEKKNYPTKALVSPVEAAQEVFNRQL